jgi:hypothetical protein
VVDRDFARAGLAAPIGPGGWQDVAIDLPAPAQPGEYELRFDLVSEGIDWFESCGSEVAVHGFRVE